MYAILRAGGFTTGGLNFDSKIRRNSTDLADLFEAHIGGMDTFAVGLEVAHRLISDGKLSGFIKNRYASFDSGDGAKFEKGQLGLAELAKLATDYGKIGITSGKQERLENILNQYLLGL
jgi:xylose isomerase